MFSQSARNVFGPGTVARTLATFSELSVTVVPLRVGSIELELAGILGRASASGNAILDDRTTWYGGTIGLRWHTARAAEPAPSRAVEPAPSRTGRWQLSASAGLLGIAIPGGVGTQFAILEIAARASLRPRLELGVALRHGREVLEPTDPSQVFDDPGTLATDQLAATLRYWLSPPSAPPSSTRIFVGGGLGVARPIHLLGAEDDEEIRPLLAVGAGFARRAGPFMFQAGLDAGYLGPSRVSGDSLADSYPSARGPIRAATHLVHLSLTAGLAYAF
jgi:hypothetical protein